MSNDISTVKKIQIENTGNATGFYSVQAFVNGESESNWETGPIRLEARSGQLEPGQTGQVVLRIDPEIVESRDVPKLFGNLVVIWGSELARKILTTHRKLQLPTFENGLHGLEEVKRLFRHPHELDLKQCSESIFKKVVKLYGARNHESFYTLPTEETLSESMLNCTLGPSEKFHQTFSTIAEVPEVAEVNRQKVDQSSKKPSLSVESAKLFTPPVKIGENVVVKIKIRNSSPYDQEIQVQGLAKPFMTNHAKFKVQPKFFINLPILYAPNQPGPHECIVELKPQNNPNNPILVKIKGTTL